MLKRTCSLFAVFVMVIGCSDEPQIPQDGSVRIAPDAIEVQISEVRDDTGACVFFDDVYQDIPINVTLLNSNGFSIGNARISLYLDYAGNTYSGLPVMELFHDVNQNGVIDRNDELVSEAEDDIFRIRTGSVDGSVMVLLRLYLSCGFRGHLFVFSGPLSGSISIETRAL